MTRITNCQFHIATECSRLSARDVLGKLMMQLQVWQVPQKHCGNIQIVMAEVLNNIFEHAYELRDGGPFRLDACHDDGIVTCIVTDHGAGFRDGRIPDGLPVALDRPRDSLPEGGFGWHMIRELTDSLHYERLADANILTVRFKVN